MSLERKTGSLSAYVKSNLIPTRSVRPVVERSACVFRAEYFTMPEYPIVHIGLGLPVQFMEGSKVAFAVVESVANFLEANFQDWVSAIEMKEYTLVDVFAPNFTLVASGRTNLDARVIAGIVESVNKANRYFSKIRGGSRDYSRAVKAFYQQHPEPFI